MLIEVKARVTRIIDGKAKRKMETFLIDREVFAEAEYTVTTGLMQEQELGTVESFDIQSLRISPIKEVCEDTMPGSAIPFIATLKDLFHDDNGNGKAIRYKVLLWANDLTQANHRAQQLVHQGYDMQIEGIKQTDYEYLNFNSNSDGHEEQ